MSYQIHIDEDSCTVTGSCVRAVPAVFAIQGDTAVVLDEEGATDAEVLAAAQSCPWGAITVIDRETGRCIYP